MARSLLVLTVLLACPCAMAQTAPPVAAEPLVIGETFTMRSAVLGETRRINVYAPAGYAESDSVRLPVLYMPDGGIGEDFLHIAGLVQISALNGTMRPFLLVGVENTERRRDLTGPTETATDREIAPRVGGSAAFRAFLRDELMPRVDGAYRTTGETALVGESLAGLFVVETLLVEPDLFDTYVAVDPSLWWNSHRMADGAVALLGGHSDVRARLFLATSREGGTEVAERLTEALREDGPAGLTVYHVPFPAEGHGTIFQPAALVGFRTVFAVDPAD